MFQQILIPLDGSEYAERALKYGIGLATLTGAEITLLSVIEHTRTPSGPVDPIRERAANGYLDEQARVLRDGGVQQVRTRVLAGEPAQAIVRAARALPADLIIMSTEGRGAQGEYGLGSVAMDALKHSHCPIFMVRIDKPDPARTEAERRWQGEGGANIG